MTRQYEDIIFLPRPKPRGREELTPWQRSAQFSPFAALTGFEDVVAEEGRLTEDPICLAEDMQLALNDRLACLARETGEKPAITVTWFCPDSRKAGGSYITTTARVKKLDETQQLLTLQTGEKIAFGQILWVR